MSLSDKKIKKYKKYLERRGYKVEKLETKKENKLKN